MSAAYWDYSALHGEHKWKDHFHIGLRQSPINIQISDAIQHSDYSKTALTFVDNEIEFSLENKGNNVSFKPVFNHNNAPCVSGGPLTEKYSFHECHFHWGRNNNKGSEHEIDGVRYDAELHLVHKQKDLAFEEALNCISGLSVLGIFIEIDDKADTPSFLRHLLTLTKHVHFKGDQYADPDHRFNPYDIVTPIANNYFTYEGSLTTPPLSECVRWIVFSNPIKVNPKHFDYLRDICAVQNCEKVEHHHDPFSRSKECQSTNLPKIGDNYRSCCQLAGRKVELLC